MTRSAWIAGSTGLVGRHLLTRLLDSPAYSQVSAPGRRAPDVTHPKLTRFANGLTSAVLATLPKPDDAYCCLGTTIAAAGSRTAFEAVDYDCVMRFASAARLAGAQRFTVVSAIGASMRALSFYLRVKGRMERDVARLGFPATHILQPSLLLGPREFSRPAEAFAQRILPGLSPLMIGGLRKYRPISADAVAAAMMALALGDLHGVHFHQLPLLTRP